LVNSSCPPARLFQAFIDRALDVTLLDGTVLTHTGLVRRRNVDEWDAG
jgi:hypothetical protein